MTEKRFVLERSDYDLKYEFRVADTNKVKKTKEDFWNEEEEIYEYRKYIAYLLENDAFLTLDEADELFNALHEENEQLKKENKELRQDNDIKFWKMQCLQSLNNNQMMLFELSRVIQQGYKVSNEFKQYLNEIKEHDKEIREKHKRLFE